SEPTRDSSRSETESRLATPKAFSRSRSEKLPEPGVFPAPGNQLLPSALSLDEDTGGHQSKKGGQEHDQQARRKRFMLGHGGRVQHLDAGSFFGFLNLCEFVLLSQRFVNRFL